MKNTNNVAFSALGVFAGLTLGGFIPVYVGLMDGELGKMAALPAAIVFGFLIIYDRILTLKLIIVFRSAGDIFLDSTRFSLGGYQVGVGGLINAGIILISIVLLIESPNKIEKKWFKNWALFLIIALIGIVMSPVPGDAIKSWLTLLTYFSIFASASALIRSNDDFIKCINLIIYSSIFPALYSIIDFIVNRNVANGDGGFRIKSTFSHPNIFAFYLMAVMVVIFYAIKSNPILRRSLTGKILSGYLFYLACLLVLTKARSAWAGCFVIFVLYAAFYEKKFFWYLLLLPIAAMFIPGIADRLGDLGQGNEVVNYSKLNSFAWRLQLWESAINWTEPFDFILGHGLQSFKESSPLFFPLAGGTKWGAHSVYVQLIFELGVVGLLVFIWLHYFAAREIIRTYMSDKLLGHLVVFLISSYLICSVSDNMFDYLSFNWYMWFIIGITVARLRLGTNMPVRAESGPNNHARSS